MAQVGMILSRRLSHGIFVLAFFTIATAILTCPLVLHLSDTIENWGDPLLNAWILAWDVRQGLTNPLQFYDANIFYPYTNTLAYSENLIPTALLAAPILLLGGNPILAYNVVLFLSFVFSGIAAYLLGLELTQRKSAALVAGFVFAFSNYRFGEFSHLQLLTAFWMPLVLLSLARFLNDASWRSGLAFAAFFCLQTLSSYYQGFFIALAVGMYVCFIVVSWLTHRRAIPNGLLAKSGILAAIIAIVLLPPSLPYFAVERELGMFRTLADTYFGSAALQNYLVVPPNNFYWRLGIPFINHTADVETLFPGLVAPLLALCALFVRGKQRLFVGFLAALVAGAFVLSLGPNLHVTIGGQPIAWPTLPYAFLHEHLPGFKAMRVPARFAVLETLGLAGLAAVGSAWLFSMVRRRAHYVLLSGVLLLLAFEGSAVPVRTTPIEAGEGVPEVYRWLAAQPDDGVIFEYPTIESKWTLYANEMERLGRYQYLSTYHWHPSITGYSGFFPPLFWSIQGEAKTFPSQSAISLFRGLDVKYVIMHSDAVNPEVWAGIERGLAVFGNDLKEVASFGGDKVFLLAPGQDRGGAQVELSMPAQAESHDYVAYLRVLNPDDRAVINTIPGQIVVEATWARADGVVIRNESQVEGHPYFPKGLTSIPLPIGTPGPGSYQLSLSVRGNGLTASLSQLMEIPGAGANPGLAVAQPEIIQVADVIVDGNGYRAGDVVPVRVKWRVPSTPVTDYTLYVKLLDAANRSVAGIDIQPLQGLFPTSKWRSGALVDDLYAVTLPPDVQPGRYTVMAGAYALPDMRKPRILDPGGKTVDSVIAGNVRVENAQGVLAEGPSPAAMVGMNLGDQVQLLGFTADKAKGRAGVKMHLTIYWQALADVDIDYTGFVHLVDRAGRPIAQTDALPGLGRFATSIWRKGDVIPDEREIVVPANLPPGHYYLKAGMYSLPGPQSLQVAQRRQEDDAERVYLGEFEVIP